MLQIVGVEPPLPGCQPSMLELKTSTMQIVRLSLKYAVSFEEVVDYNRLYTLGTVRLPTRSVCPQPVHRTALVTHSRIA